MQQPAFVTQSRLSLCSKPSSDSVGVGALGSVSDKELGAVAAWALPSPASTGGAGQLGLSPGTAHGGHPVTPSEVQGKEGAKGSAGDCDLPFLICKSLGEKDWRWSLAVHSSRMSGLSGVFAQSSGCAALQYQAQEELLLFLEGRPKLFEQPPSVITATVAGKLSLPQPSREALPSGCCSLCSTTFMLARDLS